MTPCADINELLGRMTLDLIIRNADQAVGAVLLAFSDIPNIPAGLEPQ